jgi:hypothetical protein
MAVRVQFIALIDGTLTCYDPECTMDRLPSWSTAAVSMVSTPSAPHVLQSRIFYYPPRTTSTFLSPGTCVCFSRCS